MPIKINLKNKVSIILKFLKKCIRSQELCLYRRISSIYEKCHSASLPLPASSCHTLPQSPQTDMQKLPLPGCLLVQRKEDQRQCDPVPYPTATRGCPGIWPDSEGWLTVSGAQPGKYSAATKAPVQGAIRERGPGVPGAAGSY